MVFKPKQMAIGDVYEGFTYIRKIYYSFWETVKRTINTLFATKSLTAALIGYKINSSYRKAFRNSEHYRLYNRSSLINKFMP